MADKRHIQIAGEFLGLDDGRSDLVRQAEVEVDPNEEFVSLDEPTGVADPPYGNSFPMRPDLLKDRRLLLSAGGTSPEQKRNQNRKPDGARTECQHPGIILFLRNPFKLVAREDFVLRARMKASHGGGLVGMPASPNMMWISNELPKRFGIRSR
jgi:hypothetical protein